MWVCYDNCCFDFDTCDLCLCFGNASLVWFILVYCCFICFCRFGLFCFDVLVVGGLLCLFICGFASAGLFWLCLILVVCIAWLNVRYLCCCWTLDMDLVFVFILIMYCLSVCMCCICLISFVVLGWVFCVYGCCTWVFCIDFIFGGIWCFMLFRYWLLYWLFLYYVCFFLCYL